MSKTYLVALLLLLLALVAVPIYPQKDKRKTPVKRPELMPRRGECATLMPLGDERRDVARLLRADQFLDCERDGYPRHLAPPWKDSLEGTRKLSDACEYFADKAAREYPEVGQANLKLAADRCRVNVMEVIVQTLVPGAGQLPK